MPSWCNHGSLVPPKEFFGEDVWVLFHEGSPILPIS